MLDVHKKPVKDTIWKRSGIWPIIFFQFFTLVHGCMNGRVVILTIPCQSEDTISTGSKPALLHGLPVVAGAAALASCIEFYWSIPQILLLQEYTIKLKTLVIILQMMYTSNDYTTKICTFFSRIHSWPLSATISWPRLSRAKATWGQSRGAEICWDTHDLVWNRPTPLTIYTAIYNKFAFINHWIQERMGNVMVEMQRNDMNQTSITTVFNTTPCRQCSVLFFLASRRNSAQRCAPKFLNTFNTETETLSGQKLDANDVSPSKMMTSMKLQGCASSIWPLKSKEERSWKCHSSWNQINWKPQLPTHPPHMTTGGKLLKFTLQDQETSNLQINPPSSIIDIHLVEAVQGPHTLVVTQNYCINGPPSLASEIITIIHITNSTGYTDLKWQVAASLPK